MIRQTYRFINNNKNKGMLLPVHKLQKKIKTFY